MEFRTETHNWFGSAFKEQTSKRYRYEEFVAQLEKQILKKIDCLHADFYCFNQQYFMKDLKIVLERPKFEELCPVVNSSEDAVYPILTFHSTQNVSKIGSIVKYGYILPNNEHPTFGWTVLMRTGNVYGDGVYSSPDFDTSHWYSFVDGKSAVQVIVNMVFLGKTKTVEAGKWHKEKRDKTLQGVIPSLCNTQYEDEEGVYHTLMSPDAKIFVTGDTKRIIPVAVLTVSPNAGDGAMQAYMRMPPKTLKNTTWGPRVHASQASIVDLFHVHKDYYILDLHPAIKESNAVSTQAKVVNMFSMPKQMSLLTNPVFSKGVNDFINSLSAGATASSAVYLYSDKTEKIDVSSPDSFQSLCNSPTLTFASADKYTEDIAAHLTVLLEDVLKENSNDHSNTVHVVYLFLVSPTNLEGVEKVIEQYKVFKKIQIKLIYLVAKDGSGVASNKEQQKQKKEQEKLWHHTSEFKAAFHNVDHYEQFHHIVQDKMDNLNEVFDVLGDEYTTLTKTESVNVLVQVPFPCGIIGEGFVKALEAPPVWDIDTTLSYVLVRGGSCLTEGVLINRKMYTVNFVKKRDTLLTTLKGKLAHCLDKNKKLLDKVHELLDRESRADDPVFRDNEVLLQAKELAGIPVVEGDSADANKYVVDPVEQESLEVLFSESKIAEQKLEKRVEQVLTVIAVNLKEHKNVKQYLSDYDDVNKLQCCLLPLLSRFRLYVFSYPERCKTHCGHIVEFLELLIEKLNTQSDSGDDYLTVSVRKGIKHQLQKLMTDIETFGKVGFTGKWLKQLMQIKFAKRLVKRAKSDVTSIDLIEEAKSLIVNGWSRLYGKKIHEVIDLFPYFNHKKGILVRLKLTQAAVIEPWNCIVEYVSIDQAVLSDVFNQCESGAAIRDSKGFRVTDLLLLNGQNSSGGGFALDAIDKLYYSYVFTASPYLYLPSQSLALLVNTWVSSIEKVFKIMIRKTVHNKPYDVEKVRHMIEMCYELFLRVRDRAVHNSDLVTLCEDVRRPENAAMVGKFLTTKNNVVSINKVLAALTAIPLDSVTPGDVKSVVPGKLHFALLSEASVRSSIVKVKSTRVEAEQYIMEVLGLSYDMDVTEYHFDKAHSDRALKITNAFFLKQWTNCSAFSVVGVLGFIEHLLAHLAGSGDVAASTSSAVDCVLNAFTSESIGMKNFLVQNMPEGTSGRVTQLALYLHGMKHAITGHKADHSDDGVSMEDPVELKKATISEYLKKITDRQESLRLLSHVSHAKSQKRLEELLKAATEYKEYHTIPKLFTHKEVDELNKERSKDDQLELLMPSMLLRYHCCYPDCPKYLHRFMTKRDVQTQKLVKGSTRFGLMHHFQYDGVLNNYVRNFHTTGLIIVKRSASYEEFVGKMNDYFKNSKEYKHLVDLEKNLQFLWNSK